MGQGDLFSEENFTRVSLYGYGELDLYSGFLSEKDASKYFDVFFQELLWQQPEILVYGKFQRIPRLQAWYGDEGRAMTYSGTRFEPEPWRPQLLHIKNKIEAHTKRAFNSVLVNLYRNGLDSVGWHADDEIELGREPTIASLSLGATRKFSLKPKNTQLANGAQKTMHLNLTSGDLLVMSGLTQEYWHHAVLKEDRITAPRINLTFRNIVR